MHAHDLPATLPLIEPACLRLDADIHPRVMALVETLMLRHSQRAFAPEGLPLYQLSRLLWAAFGYNRPEHALRTAPSACNSQEMDIFVALREGLFRYDPRTPALVRLSSDDIRPLTGSQEFVAQAPINLIYVADFARMPQVEVEQRAIMAAYAAGAISQNVSLMCAAEGLGCVVRGLIDRARLAPVLGLQPEQHIMLAQTVGHPA